jgi:hypothetical protein
VRPSFAVSAAGSDPNPACGWPSLLAALWPDSYASMDVRDRRAAIGLKLGRYPIMISVSTRRGRRVTSGGSTTGSARWRR